MINKFNTWSILIILVVLPLLNINKLLDIGHLFECLIVLKVHSTNFHYTVYFTIIIRSLQSLNLTWRNIVTFVLGSLVWIEQPLWVIKILFGCFQYLLIQLFLTICVAVRAVQGLRLHAILHHYFQIFGYLFWWFQFKYLFIVYKLEILFTQLRWIVHLKVYLLRFMQVFFAAAIFNHISWWEHAGVCSFCLLLNGLLFEFLGGFESIVTFAAE